MTRRSRKIDRPYKLSSQTYIEYDKIIFHSHVKLSICSSNNTLSIYNKYFHDFRYLVSFSLADTATIEIELEKLFISGKICCICDL